MSGRPFLITVIGLFTLLFGFAALAVGGLFLFIPESNIQELWDNLNGTESVTYALFKGIFNAFGITLIIIALISFFAGFAYLRGWTIAWYLGILIYVVIAIMSVMSIMSLVSVISLVLSILVLYYMFRPKVRAFFGVGRSNS